MKVLFLSQIVPYPPHGGVLQRGFNLIRELGRRAEVHLLAFVHPDILKTEAQLAESRSALAEFCKSVEYFPLWPKQSKAHLLAGAGLSLCSSEPFSVLAHRSARFQRRVTEILATGTFDILHVDTIALCQFIPPGCRTPTVLTHHNLESMLMARRAQVETRGLMRFYLRRESAKLEACERRLSPACDLNVMMSNPDAGGLTKSVVGDEPGLIRVPVLDAAGNPVLDADGNPVYTDEPTTWHYDYVTERRYDEFLVPAAIDYGNGATTSWSFGAALAACSIRRAARCERASVAWARSVG